MTLDERLGVPSASAMERIHHCPASHKMGREAEKIVPDTGSKDAEAGELTHGIISGEESDENAPYRAAQTAEMCEDQAAELLDEWRGPASEGEIEMIQERRYYLTQFGTVIDKPTSAVIFSGRIDRLHIQGERGILFDWKTLNGEHAAAIENRQLADYAVLVMTRHKLKSLRVCLVQPWKGRPTVCDYDEESLKMAFDMLQTDLLREAQATPADAKAGPWCTHCNARFGCETFKRPVLQEIERVNPMSIAGLPGKEQAVAMFARAMELSPAQHIAAYRGLKMIGRYLHAIESSFEARVDDGEIPGWERRTKLGNREITDAQKAFDALSALGVTTEDVLAACKIPIGAMEEAVRMRSGVKKKTANRTYYNLGVEQAARAVNDGLEAVGAIARRADTSVIVEVETNRLEEGA